MKYFKIHDPMLFSQQSCMNNKKKKNVTSQSVALSVPFVSWPLRFQFLIKTREDYIVNVTKIFAKWQADRFRPVTRHWLINLQNGFIPSAHKFRRITLEIVQNSYGMLTNTTIFRRDNHIDAVYTFFHLHLRSVKRNRVNI